MNQCWVTTVERLAELDRQQAFEQLADALNGLPQTCPQEHSAAIAHWRGKVALIAGKTAEALPHLALAATLSANALPTITCWELPWCASSSGWMLAALCNGLWTFSRACCLPASSWRPC